MVTFVVLDLFAHDGQVKWNVMFMASHNTQELKLVFVQNLKDKRENQTTFECSPHRFHV